MSPPGDTRFIGYCVVFKDREEALRADGRPPSSWPVEPPAARRSLKTQQHAAGSAPKDTVRPTRPGRHS